MLRMKYILALVLVALCAAVMAVPAMAVAGDDVYIDPDETDLPSGDMVVGEEYDDADITIENTGINDWVGDGTLTGYSLWSMEGPTDAAVLTDRWGMDGVAVEDGEEIPVDDDGDPGEYDFEWVPVAPSLLTMVYDDAIAATEAAVVDTLECGWMMSDGSDVFGNEKESSDVSIIAFEDVPSTHWAFAQIQQCSATVTEAEDFIVQGYGGGTYWPSWSVTRAQMAVFIARAAAYTDDDPAEPSFEDVNEDYWAYEEIEQCVTNGVVQGYADYFGAGLDAYLPLVAVDRAQMAVYVGRAVAGTTTGLYADAFDDVDGDFWAADWIQECVDLEIVQGYGDGTYLPDLNVSRAQMAVFIWRGLVRDRESDVVLGMGVVDPTAHAFVVPSGGEGTADEFDAGSLTYYGWSEADLEPGAVVYLVLDGVRVGAGDVDFRVYHEEADVEVDDDTATVALVNQTANAEAAGGNCYYVVSYQVPTAIVDAYEYVVEITLPQGGVLDDDQDLEFEIE